MKNRNDQDYINDFRIKLRHKKSLRADLVIIQGDEVEVAAEFKYEPRHTRTRDFPESKLEQSFVFWGGRSNPHSVENDIKRAKEYFNTRKAKTAYSIFIDEGGRFRKKEPYPESRWQDWGETAVLISRFGQQ